MKLYYPKTHYNKKYRGLVFPLLKPFIKGVRFSDEERISLYGVSEKDFQIIETIKESDFVILTMAWNYYIASKQESLAIDFINKCASLNKKVLIYNAGDFGVGVPFFENCIVFRPSGYLSKFNRNEYALPVFIGDPLKKYFQTDTVFKTSLQPKAVVGFCGQANRSVWNAGIEIMRTAVRNIKSYVGFSKNETQQLLSTSFLRAAVLHRLQKSGAIETNFIFRTKYRAGVTSEKDSHKTTQEFYENIKNSHYVVCVRGAGNFSVRFYEALAMGRIPIFINTDCPLPLSKHIDWNKQLVWVDYNEQHRVAEKTKEFHQKLSQQDLIDLQEANRALWKERLTLGGFFKFFLKKTSL